jgi:hypothetical protein
MCMTAKFLLFSTILTLSACVTEQTDEFDDDDGGTDEVGLVSANPVMRVRTLYTDSNGIRRDQIVEQPMCTRAVASAGVQPCFVHSVVKCKPNTPYEVRFVVRPGASPITRCTPTMPRVPNAPYCRSIETGTCGGPPLKARETYTLGDAPLSTATVTSDGGNWYGNLYSTAER